ncbi:hypothetical protein [Candidatus Magnetobacterium casense]|nr:hypothetical protein [Candidatus Magnetobacterium casensis]
MKDDTKDTLLAIGTFILGFWFMVFVGWVGHWISELLEWLSR